MYTLFCLLLTKVRTFYTEHRSEARVRAAIIGEEWDDDYVAVSMLSTNSAVTSSTWDLHLEAS